MTIFERVLYIREIDPVVELAWTRWLIEEEEHYNEIFLHESTRELQSSCPIAVAGMWNRKWAEMVMMN